MSLDNFREYGALILLFRGCTDDRLRQQVLKLIPELAAWEPEEPGVMRRWVLRAVSGEGEKLGSQVVICRESELPIHEAEFHDRFDLATDVRIMVSSVEHA